MYTMYFTQCIVLCLMYCVYCIVCWLWQCLYDHVLGDCVLVVAVSIWSCDQRLFVGCGSVNMVM